MFHEAPSEFKCNQHEKYTPTVLLIFDTKYSLKKCQNKSILDIQEKFHMIESRICIYFRKEVSIRDIGKQGFIIALFN